MIDIVLSGTHFMVDTVFTGEWKIKSAISPAHKIVASYLYRSLLSEY